VADQKRRNAGAEPISRHPLFPAIVALWGGAFFGLASIAVSPALIERLVLATGIDRIVPMAAPPLGTTTRILLALAATTLGAIAGFLAARRFARPASGSAQAPGSSADFDFEEGEAPRRSRMPGRQRALAALEDAPTDDTEAPAPARDADEREPARHEPARHEPVAEQPQILNVADLDLDELDGPASIRETDLQGDDEAERPAPAFRPHISAVELDEDEAQASLPAWLDAEAAWREPEPGYPSGEDAVLPAIPEGERGFQQIFQAQLDQAGIGQDAIARSDDQAGPGFKLLPRLQSIGSGETPTAAEPPRAEASDAAAPEHMSAVSTREDTQGAFEARPAAEATAARRIAEADLQDLSPVELLERLALAMAERRERARHVAETAAPSVPAPPVVSAEFTPLREVSPAGESAASGARPFDAPPAFERLAPAPFAAPAPFLVPVVDSPEDAQGTIDVSPHGGGETALAEPSPVPQALRPLSFAEEAEVEGSLPGYVPPRHIGLTAVDSPPFAAPPFSAPPFSAASFPTSPFLDTDAEQEDDEETALQQGYSSLLNLSRQAGARRNMARAIRFAEPEPLPADEDEEAEASHWPRAVQDDATGEQMAHHATFARPALASPPPQSADAASDGEERLFDAPGTRPDASSPEATERALRAALATLQRMSGAA
jgi:hypothetical protein